MTKLLTACAVLTLALAPAGASVLTFDNIAGGDATQQILTYEDVDVGGKLVDVSLTAQVESLTGATSGETFSSWAIKGDYDDDGTEDSIGIITSASGNEWLSTNNAETIEGILIEFFLADTATPTTVDLGATGVTMEINNPGNFGADPTGNQVTIGGTTDATNSDVKFANTTAVDSILIEAWADGVAGSGYKNTRFSLHSLDLVPEPTTMALLGLGGLAVLRRRRA
jgi:hypothetical protein